MIVLIQIFLPAFISLCYHFVDPVEVAAVGHYNDVKEGLEYTAIDDLELQKGFVFS